jgi:glucose-6-phosphate 1-dehydrogenase
MRGDATLFTRDDEVEAQWEICDPILRAWEEEGREPEPYEAGGQGPAAAARILLPGCDAWRAI